VEDPCGTWGRCSLTKKPCTSADDYFTDSEQRFIKWAKEKAWFPLQTETGLVLLVLLRGDDRPYEMPEVLSSWLFAQARVSYGLRPAQPHQAFCDSLAAVSRLTSQDVRDEDHFLQSVLHCITSDRGFRWNRSWVFDVDHREGSVTLRCRAAIGELNKERWGNAIAFGSLPDNALNKELDYPIRFDGYKRDELYRRCVADRQISLSISDQQAQLILEHQSGLPESVQRLAAPIPEEVSTSFIDQIMAHVAHAEFQPDSDLHALLVPSGQKDLLFLFSELYTGETPSILLTTLFLNHAVRVMSATLWDEGEQIDELNAESPRLECPEPLRSQLLSRMSEISSTEE
jgi:hypothetical protein